MAKNILYIKEWATKKFAETSKVLEGFKKEEENKEMGFQFYLLANQFERKWKAMYLHIEYNRILSVIDEHPSYLENVIDRLQYQLLECKPMRSSTDPITNITSIWETEMQQILLKEYKSIIDKANREGE